MNTMQPSPRPYTPSRPQSLQDPFLNTLRRERVPVSIYLVNGIKLQGTIESFDQVVVLLRGATSQMVYKHAISTVVPARMVRMGPAGAYLQPEGQGQPRLQGQGHDDGHHDDDDDYDDYEDEDEDYASDPTMPPMPPQGS